MNCGPSTAPGARDPRHGGRVKSVQRPNRGEPLMTTRNPMPRPSRNARLPRALLLFATAILSAACPGATGVVSERRIPTYRITGVTVEPLDRRDTPDGRRHFFIADTLRGQIAFMVTTHADLVQTDGPGASNRAPAADEMPGFIANPTEWQSRWLSVDRPVKHRGVEIPANTNLLAVEAIRNSFNGSTFDLSFGLLTPFAIGQVHVRTPAFEITPGPYVFSFRWATAAGEQFRDDVAVYIDVGR